MSNNIDEVSRYVSEIASKVSVHGKVGLYDLDAMALAFKEIEGLDALAIEAVTRNLRNSAVKQILIQAGEPALKYLEPALNSPDREIREQAVTALGQIGAPALGILTSTLQHDPDEHIQISAAYALAHLGEDGIGVLREALHGDNAQWRIASVYGLSGAISTAQFNRHLGDEHEPMIDLILKCLDDTSSRVRARAIGILGDIKRISLDSLDKALDDQDSEVQKNALLALYKLDINASNAYVLVKAFEDADGGISTLAIEQL